MVIVMYDYDIVIVGGGVSGTAVARELSRYKAKICVIEKEEDVCCGTSKANSAIIHAGYDAVPGSLKAKLNVRGNEMMEKLAKELDFPFERNGSFVICQSEADMPALQRLCKRGKDNGVTGLRILPGEEVLAMEPNITENVHAALYAETAGIVCPFGLNIALAESAYINGVEFRFRTKVRRIEKKRKGFQLYTDRGELTAGCVVNAAGVYADELHNMVSGKKLHIVPRAGEYCLLDKEVGNHVKRTVFALPGKLGKGILVTPTIHGNLLIGPTAADTENKEGTNTTREGLDQVIEKAGMSVRNLPLSRIITSFTGLRAHEEQDDFVIGEAEDAEGFIDCAGIESPGLTSCPAIGEMVAQIIRDKMGLEEKDDFIPTRKGILNPAALSKEERAALVKENPAYGHIVCRCEMITEGEIIDAVTRPLGARTVDGIKRRTRAGMGRCQSGFCLPGTMEILSREGRTDMLDITKSGGSSRILAGSGKSILRREDA
ncbi:MAG: NAD(P)/FAD-dependent oxidoreductase [Roseburia sp.]|nr:NAD(P)/FAD-dependent oxidoreductase [Roseburia sp.]MCM1202080.1 NAD(P)/FAD-dependent oxidoreductase [Bacteroides fragilis]